MPRDITVTFKGGQTHVYKNAPDDISPDDVQARAEREFGQPVTAMDGGRGDNRMLDTVADVVRSVPGGLAQGVNSMIGLPGDIQELVGRGTFAALNALTGQDKKIEDRPRTFVPDAPTSSDLNKAASEPFGGYYEPQTTAGEYANTIASFAPAALSPGSIIQRGARVIVPAVTSETAGQITKDTPYEPYARAAGALVGGVGEGLSEAALSSRKNPIPTKEQLREAADGLYTEAKQAGVVIKADAYDNLTDDISAAVKEAGTHPKLHPKVDAVLDVLKEARGQDLTLSDLERLRRVARSAAGSIDADEARVGNVILNRIDDFMDAPPQGAFVAGDQVATQKLKEARKMWSQVRKSDMIDGAIERAKNAVGANYTAAGYDTALRQQFRRIADNPKLMRGLSEQERAAITKVVRGGPVQNVLRIFGKLAPRGIVSAAPGLGVGTIDPMLGAAVWGVGESSRYASNLMTSRNAQLANELMRATTAAQIPKGQDGRQLLIDILMSQADPKPAH